MALAQQPEVSLDRLAIRQRERGFLLGGTDTGKSTLADALAVDFLNTYASKGARRLILDSKPRYRAEHHLNGTSAKRRYKRWDHGPPVPGSIIVEQPGDLRHVWSLGARTVIAQGYGDDRHEIERLAAIASAFIEESRAGRPQLLQVDETMDYFHSNGAPIGQNSLVRAARAGRERGTAALYCSQRAYNIPKTLLSELTRLYLFRIDAIEDLKRLRDMGAPIDIRPPEAEHAFYYWTKAAYRRVWGPYRLAL